MTRKQKDKSLFSMRKSPSQARSKATIEVILDAATQVLVDIGYSDTTTNKIANCAGVSIGSVYEYFPGKEAIFAELRRREERKLFELAMSFGEPQSIRDLIQKHHYSYLQFIRTNLTLHVALLNEVPHFAVDEKNLHIHKVYMPWAVEFFRSHQQELRPFKDIAQVVDFIIHVGRATIDSYALSAPEMLEDPALEDMLADMIERYLFEQ